MVPAGSPFADHETLMVDDCTDVNRSVEGTLASVYRKKVDESAVPLALYTSAR